MKYDKLPRKQGQHLVYEGQGLQNTITSTRVNKYGIRKNHQLEKDWSVGTQVTSMMDSKQQLEKEGLVAMKKTRDFYSDVVSVLRNRCNGTIVAFTVRTKFLSY